MPTLSYYYNTTSDVDVISVIHDVNRVLREKPMPDGLVTVISPDAGAGITVIEMLPDIVAQLKEAFAVFPGSDLETKNKRKEVVAVAPRVRASLLGRSISIPVVDGKLSLSPREEIVFVDFDKTSKRRQIMINVVGAPPAPAQGQKQPQRPQRRF